MIDGSQRIGADPSLLPEIFGRGLPPRVARLRLSFVVIAGDAAVIVAAFILVWLLSTKAHPLLGVLAVTVPIYIGTALNSDAYSLALLRDGSLSTSRALRSMAFSFSALFLLLYFMRTEQQMPRALLLASMLASLVFVAMLRHAIAGIIRRWPDTRLTAEMAILDGISIALPNSIVRINAAESGIVPDMNDPIALNRFAKLVRDLDRVVIACKPEARENWAMMLKGSNVRGEIVVDDIGAFGAFGMSALDQHTTLLVSSGPLPLSQRFTKRCFDLVLCISALIALAPALALTALAIKLDSRGPVFFRQRRVGQGNAFFEILKFRSMNVDDCDADGKVSTKQGDHRITRVGRFIRSTSVDELPQLFNVLSGAMSLVGPRPHALGSLAGSELFWEVDHRYWHRHAAKPGLTGLAQVRGFRGATHRREDLINRLQADLEYLNGWSIWRDISILFATFRVLVHRNAF